MVEKEEKVIEEVNQKFVDKMIGYPKPEEKNKTVDIKYLAVRYIEGFCIAMFIFGFLWNGTEVMQLTTPQFMMLYGGFGALVCEVLSRLFSRKKD